MHKYNIKTNFLQFNGLKAAIKVFAKKLKLDTMRNKLSNPMLPTNISVFLRSTKGSKDLYNILNQNNYTPTSKKKWQEIYDIQEETWKDIYSAPFKQICSTKLQWFQVSIIHRLLPTKKYLYNIKAMDSPNCNFCYQEETIPHMLWSCPETFSLIQQLNQWLSATNTYTNNVEELFIFNIGKNIEKANQHIILATKYYIYLTKRLNKPLSLIALKHRLKKYYLTLKSIAVKNKKLDTFEKKSGILIKTYLKILKFKH